MCLVMRLDGFVTVVLSVKVMGVSQVRVVRRFLVVTGSVLLSSFLVVFGCMFVMLSSFCVVRMGHGGFPCLYLWGRFLAGQRQRQHKFPTSQNSQDIADSAWRWRRVVGRFQSAS